MPDREVPLFANARRRRRAATGVFQTRRSPSAASRIEEIRYIFTIAPRNLINLSHVAKGYGSRSVLEDVTLGVSEGERIGIVGENGAGKSTLLRLIGGLEEPDAGTVIRTGGTTAELVSQLADLDPERTIRQELVGERAEHEWAGDAAFRSVLDGLLGGVALTRFPEGMDTRIKGLSGGEQRRITLAHALLDSPQLLLLDEPTNHLDVEGIGWLAGLLSRRRGTVLVITHDRWFLDAVCTRTWEVADQNVEQHDGGYSAYVLARAERDRQATAREDRRRQLVRKELAWLRRGPPARTSKPKFRIEAANALIDDEPPARDTVELLRFATARLGDRVLDAVDVSVAIDSRPLLNDITWRLGPGQRVALVGANGTGKTTLIRLLAGDRQPDAGVVQRGSTVRLAELSQDTAELPPDVRVLQALEQVRQRTTTSTGQELTAGSLAERFGFRGEKLYTLTGELSGGERRRLQLMRLLMTEPNVLLLDEPTNDLDIDTLTALEDLLDGWPGTLVVVSHDRYFVERVCDDVYGLAGDGGLRHYPGGIDQYLASRAELTAHEQSSHSRQGVSDPTPGAQRQTARRERQSTRRELSRVERELERAEQLDAELQASIAAASSDATRLRQLSDELTAIAVRREELEASWLELSEQLEA